ncbi:MAG: uroporphyrinogen-III synthase [Ardenticatenia bacterium]|nr:uroporphyrinogen-III synthase [Ardenticatenia bacterium]
MRKPLDGKRVLVTRARRQARPLAERLRAEGAEPVLLPTIEIVPPADGYAALDAALRALDTFDWVIFTSVNGVAHTCARLEALGLRAHALNRLGVAAIGPATARALQGRGVRVDVIPPTYVAEAVLEVLPLDANMRVLLPRADTARPALREGLQAAGARVVEVTAYRTVPAQLDPGLLARLEQSVDVLTFTSGSTVRHFVALLGAERARTLAHDAVVAAIGPITARVAQELRPAPPRCGSGTHGSRPGGRPPGILSGAGPCLPEDTGPRRATGWAER